MKTVILLRHAKSSWADPELPDHERPLNRRGWQAAPRMAEWLAHRGHLPDTILSSSSLRTRQTVARMAEAVPALPEPQLDSTLYHAAPERMRERLRRLPRACASAMLVGHQPGLSAFARKLAGGRVRPRCARAFEHFPTAAAAVLTVPIDDWAELRCGTADFIDFAVPKELAPG